ncbi:mitochondrial amidoxime reducing component 2 [Pistacia vera]|uniref:mitochondrial amidoxime reducing component 2 n=1 Tax=Pistacia vera TaxID=55513 RepID=UPI0012633DB9|nr:mitochondrial amidoxime reducing component 2 [Pistacia vera]
MEKVSSSSEASAKVTSIFIYPVKSCRVISVSQAPLTPTGFRWDRQWIIVNQKGRAVTQRNEPKLALVEVELPKEAFLEGWEPTGGSYMVIKAPGMDVLKISLSKPHDVTDGVSVWEWSGSALDEGAEAANWFTKFLGKTSRLVRFNAASENRPVDPEYARGHNLMFSDQYPYMLLSQGSLDALNKLLNEPVPVNRFRPNILVDGCEPFSEDLWTEVRINKFTFEGVKLCSRCKVPTINQDTGIAGSEPSETLMKIRSDKVLRPNRKQQGKIYFGQSLVCKDSLTKGRGNVVKVGDPVFVLRKVSSAAEAAA